MTFSLSSTGLNGTRIHEVPPSFILGSLWNHNDDGNKNPTNLHIWQWKTVVLHALHVHFSSFDIFKAFFVLSMTWNKLFCGCVDDVSIWWQMFNFVFLCPKRWFQINSRIVRTHFFSIMTLNNWKMIAETRSYIFRWRSRFLRRRVCLSSLFSWAPSFNHLPLCRSFFLSFHIHLPQPFNPIFLQRKTNNFVFQK